MEEGGIALAVTKPTSTVKSALHATLSPTASYLKRYGVDKTSPGAFKATRQSTQIPQSPGYLRALKDANERDGLYVTTKLNGGHGNALYML